MLRLLALLAILFCQAAAADPRAGEKPAQLCLLCHRAERGWALLEAQPAGYLVAQVEAYKSGKRADPAMTQNVARLTAREVRDIAEYFASRPLPPTRPAADAALAQAGAAVAAARDCARCHKPGFEGGDRTPRLAGQIAPYLAQQFEAFAAGKRAHPVPETAALTPTEGEQLAAFFASLGR